MWIKPVPGRLVRDPVTREVVPEGGRDVDDHNPYWLRKLRDGDVVKGAAPKKTRTLSATPSAPEASPAAMTEEG
mgnify:CR=1 FL=1